MNNGTLELMADCDYDFDKIFKGNKTGILAMIVGDLAHSEGYIKGLEQSVKYLKETLEKVNETNN